MRYAIYMPPNTKDLAINQTMVAYGNRQNATEFAQTNNSDLLRSLKQLMETRLIDDRPRQVSASDQVKDNCKLAWPNNLRQYIFTIFNHR